MFKRGRGRESARADTRTKRNGDASVVLLNLACGHRLPNTTCIIRRTHLTLASPRPPPIARVWTSLRATRNSTGWMDKLQEVLLDEPHAGRRQPFVRRAPSSRSVLALVAADLYRPPRQRLRRPPLLLLRCQMGRSARLRILGRAVVCCCCLWPRATAAALRCSSCS